MPKKNISLNQNIKRIIDLALVFFAIFLSILPMIIISILVKITSPGPSLYWSDRVGQYNKIFQMPKFRTMFVNTPQVATHLLENGVDKVFNFFTEAGLGFAEESLAYAHAQQ